MIRTTNIKIQAAVAALDLADHHDRNGDEAAMTEIVNTHAERLGLRPSHDAWETRGMIEGAVIAAEVDR